MKKYLSLAIISLLTIISGADEIKGRVMAAENRCGLPGVKVTNGIQVTVTDQEGNYSLPKGKYTRFVSVIMPADRKAASFYIDLKRKNPRNTDFLLHKRPRNKAFRFVHLSDTETYKGENLFEDIFGYARNTGCAFIVHTGDICKEKGIAFHAAHFTSQKAGIPLYYTIGNHDYCKDGYGEKIFEDAFGPVIYAFEEGDFLFIAVPMPRGGDFPARYSSSDSVHFVRNLLQHTSTTQKLIFLSHYRDFFAKENKFGYGKEWVDLSSYNFKALFFGHSHKHCVSEWGTGKLYNTGMTRGGGGNSVAAFRSVSVDRDGNITTELKPLYVKNLFHIGFSPKKSIDGGHLVSVACYRTQDDIKRMTLECPEWSAGSPVDLKKVSPWQYCGKIFPKTDRFSFAVTAEFFSGEKIAKKYVFPSPTQEQVPFRLHQILSVPGTVLFGSPIVKDGVIYVAAADEAEEKNGSVSAFDIENGNLLWRYCVGHSFRNRIALVNGVVYGCDSRGIRIKLDAATGRLLEKIEPAASGQNYGGVQVLGNYIVSGSEQALSVSDLNGKVLWKNKAQEDFHRFGSAGEALLAGDVLYTAVNWGKILARKISDGTILWQYKGKGAFAQPTLALNPDGNLIVAAGKYNLLLDAENGHVLKQNNRIPCGTVSSPVILGDRFFIGTQRYGIGAVDAETLAPLWLTKRATGRAIIATVQYNGPSFTVESTPVIWGDKLLISAMNGFCYCLSQQDGKEIWHLFCGVPLLNSPVRKDNLLIQADYAGRIFIWHLKK